MQQPQLQQHSNFDLRPSSSSSSPSTVTIVQSCTGLRNGDDARESRSKRTYLEFDSTPQHSSRKISDGVHWEPSFHNGGCSEKRHKLESPSRLGLQSSDFFVNRMEQKQALDCHINASDQVLHFQFANVEFDSESNQHFCAKSQLNDISTNADLDKDSKASESLHMCLPWKAESMDNQGVIAVDHDVMVSENVSTDASVAEAETDNNTHGYAYMGRHRDVDLKIAIPEQNQEQNEEHSEYVSSTIKPSSKEALIDVTNKFQVDSVTGVKETTGENDIHRLQQRQKQIEYGKNTLGYERYLELVPKSKRSKKDPQTPNPKQVCSKRSWDGQIRKWRRLLHNYDPPVEDGEEIAEDFTVLKTSQKDEESKGNEVLDNNKQITVKKDYESSIHEDWTEL